jgi:septum formation protein
VEPRLILASASPRRARILESLGVAFRVVAPDVDEALAPGEDGAAAALRLARAKARVVAASQSLPVLAADTLVLLAGRVMGKPASVGDAASMLRALQGRSHEVVTGVCLVSGGAEYADLERTAVRFTPMSEAEIAAYVATGEPMDKAGAYHIDGRGALYVAGIDGSPSNVAGLPVSLVKRLAATAAAGIFA